jgi:hypothetical protein
MVLCAIFNNKLVELKDKTWKIKNLEVKHDSYLVAYENIASNENDNKKED